MLIVLTNADYLHSPTASHGRRASGVLQAILAERTSHSKQKLWKDENHMRRRNAWKMQDFHRTASLLSKAMAKPHLSMAALQQMRELSSKLSASCATYCLTGTFQVQIKDALVRLQAIKKRRQYCITTSHWPSQSNSNVQSTASSSQCKKISDMSFCKAVPSSLPLKPMRNTMISYCIVEHLSSHVQGTRCA